MEENYDEQLLLSQRVDINSEQPIISQVLRIAVYDEFKAYETYTKVMEKFGFVEPFVNIREAESRHYSALIPLLEKYGIEVPLNNWAEKIEVPSTYVECCELGVAAEIKNVAMYDNLLSHTQEEDIRDVLFRLQAASYNNHLPAFRNCVINYYSVPSNPEFNQEDLMEKLGEYQGLLDDLMTGNVDQNKLTQLFSKLNISMISGLGFGSASIALLNNYMNNKNNKE
ncbi:DUF2202 domain-containing protein [Arcobacter sp. LA11]|uniref:ferritin-like domain-containing protein n=1 Tax=Arcobacter sp. LA11 TaxID=1898176 RepID=UPI000934912B|nr:DUF2202 domain-containing protein [Arcobacter sp. LA11]